MTEITILDTIDIYQLSGWQFLLALSPMILAAIICFTRMHIAFKKGTAEEQARGVVSFEHWHPKELLIILFGTIICIATFICLNTFCPAEYVETQYEVKVSDSASFNKVFKAYTIIEEKENTYIVKERN